MPWMVLLLAAVGLYAMVLNRSCSGGMKSDFESRLAPVRTT